MIISSKLEERFGTPLAVRIKKTNGFYVEVGARDGISESKTHFLEVLGWQGILIESSIEKCGRCMINRPMAAVLNYHCVANDNNRDLNSLPTGGAEHNSQYGPRTKGCGRTLASLLKEYEVQQFDLLAINEDEDVLNVLKGFDFSVYNPRCILIGGAVNEQISAYLSERSYKITETIQTESACSSILYENLSVQSEAIADDSSSSFDPVSLLDRAWDIAARSNASYPGAYIAYYSLNVGGRKFAGERPWEKRWDYIGKALRDACGGSLEGKKILELGCNLGLLSVWAAREGAICDGYEYEADILEGCKLVAEAYQVSDRCAWHQADFNSQADTDKIGGDFDVCTCLSVMNWVRNKKNLIDFLSRQKIVLYEGHDSDDVETDRLRQAKFTNIRSVAVSERNRSVFVATHTVADEAPEISWDEFEKRYGLAHAPYYISQTNRGDGMEFERIYFKTEVWKARLSNHKNPAKFSSPYEEAQFVKKLAGVPGVCRFKEFTEKPDHTVFIMEYFPHIGTLADVKVPPEFKAKVDNQKHAIIKEINKAGILHNDLYDRNFLVDSNYNLCLIDFDQAQPAEGRNDYDHGYYFQPSMLSLDNAENEPVSRQNALLERAWDIAARSNASYPGAYIAYYSLNVGGRKFAGERPWEKRWDYIGKALRDACGGSLEGKKILELGCNLGLLSVWAAREGAICDGYEFEADILEGCKLVAEAYQVSDRCAWHQADFNKQVDIDKIGDDFDICTCLSVMNWVRNKKNLIDFLSRQKIVLYEGHDSDDVETDRLRQAKFTNIRSVAVSERNRSVFVASKEGISSERTSNRKKAEDWDYEGRFQEILSDPNNAYIPRVKDAGKVIDGFLIMHNGLRICTGQDSYYGDFAKILESNRGVHEPQEERVFSEVLRYIPDGGTMIELGAYWAFYSMWFYKEIKNPTCYMIEPDPKFLEVGKKNFAANGMKGEFIQAKIGDDGLRIDEFLKERNIQFVDILHADIQGAEKQMLEGAERSLNEGKIGYVFVSTHSQQLHYFCHSYLRAHGYTIIASADFDNETYCFDGVLVGRLSPMKGLAPIEIALRGKEQDR